MEGGKIKENGKHKLIKPMGKDKLSDEMLLHVTTISLDYFEKNPRIIFNFSVTVFAKWTNDEWHQLKYQQSCDTILEYIDAGYGLLLGHNVLKEVFLSKLVNNEIYEKFGLDYSNQSPTLATYKVFPIQRNSLIMKYPHNINHPLSIPPALSTGFSHLANIWFSVLPETHFQRSSFYLATHDNVGIIQTGKAEYLNYNEAKIIANTIYYLSKRENFYIDRFVVNEPEILYNVDTINRIISWKVKNDHSYLFKVIARRKDTNEITHTIQQDFSSNHKEYYCFFISPAQYPRYEKFCYYDRFITNLKKFSYLEKNIGMYAHIYPINTFNKTKTGYHVYLHGNPEINQSKSTLNSSYLTQNTSLEYQNFSANNNQNLINIQTKISQKKSNKTLDIPYIKPMNFIQNSGDTKLPTIPSYAIIFSLLSIVIITILIITIFKSKSKEISQLEESVETFHSQGEVITFQNPLFNLQDDPFEDDFLNSEEG